MPLSFHGNNNLTTVAVFRILKKSASKYRREISEAPPMLPLEGQMFLYSLGPDKTFWEEKEKEIEVTFCMTCADVSTIL